MQDGTITTREDRLHATAAEYSFRGRRDKFAAGGPILERGSGSVVWDTTGKEYLDFNSGQMCGALGHNHPRITQALMESCETLVHCGNTILNVKEIELAEELGKIVPRPLKKSTFLSSGSDANESAMTVAKKATGGFEVCAPHLNLAGLGYGARQVTFVDGWHTGYGVGQPGVYALIAPYCYRCPLKLTYPECGLQCLKLSMELLDAQTCGEMAAVLTEPMFSAGGVIEPPAGWLGALKEETHKRGMLLIFDEAQTGLGKTGDMFGCEKEGVVPDIMTLSKHFGGGIEISAMIATPEVEEKAFEAGLVMGHSHTNDPIQCNAAIASLEIIVDGDMPAVARESGAYWRGHLEQMQQKYEQIGDLRGRGLIQGVEFVKDCEGKEPYFGFGDEVGRLCNQKGLFLSVRRKASVLRFVPPFTTTREQFDFAASVIDESIGEVLDRHAASPDLVAA